MQTLVSFLTKRVRSPDKDDWGKLKQGLWYLKAARHMKLNITVDSLTTIRWYVDASYGVHLDCKGHTSMMMNLGAGASMSMSKAHKLNTKSSTEAEPVGVYHALPDNSEANMLLKLKAT